MPILKYHVWCLLQVFSNIAKVNYDFSDQIWELVSDSAQDLVRSLVVRPA